MGKLGHHVSEGYMLHADDELGRCEKFIKRWGSAACKISIFASVKS